MNKKEAFRELSHMFHGKQSGKQKVEKKLKKIDQERKREAASSLDAGVTGADGRKGRQAGVRLQ